MLGLGETNDEIIAVMKDMRAHLIDHITLGQYLPAEQRPPPCRSLCDARRVQRAGADCQRAGLYPRSLRPDGALSYHADLQTKGEDVSNALTSTRPTSPKRPFFVSLLPTQAELITMTQSLLDARMRAFALLC